MDSIISIAKAFEQDIIPKKKEKYCDLVIPVWNNLELTRRCLESILAYTRVPNYQVILVDNASDKPAEQFLKTFHKKYHCPGTVIRNEENLGNIKAVNQGIRLSEADYICILDNDTVVFPGWLEKMILAAESREEIGIVNPGSNGLGYKKPWYLSWGTYAQVVADEEKNRRPEISTASGFCMLVKRVLIDTIGCWSEDYGMGYYEDTDYSRRAAGAGFVCVHARDAFVYHEEHASFRHLKKVKERISRPNRQLFESRFGKPERIVFCMDHPAKQIRTWLADEAFRMARDNNWILIFINSETQFPEFKEHGFIRLVNMPRPLFFVLCLVRILKKKKKFGRICSNNKGLLRVFGWFSWIHRAELDLMG